MGLDGRSLNRAAACAECGVRVLGVELEFDLPVLVVGLDLNTALVWAVLNWRGCAT